MLITVPKCLFFRIHRHQPWFSGGPFGALGVFASVYSSIGAVCEDTISARQVSVGLISGGPTIFGGGGKTHRNQTGDGAGIQCTYTDTLVLKRMTGCSGSHELNPSIPPFTWTSILIVNTLHSSPNALIFCIASIQEDWCRQWGFVMRRSATVHRHDQCQCRY